MIVFSNVPVDESVIKKTFNLLDGLSFGESLFAYTPFDQESPKEAAPVLEKLL